MLCTLFLLGIQQNYSGFFQQHVPTQKQEKDDGNGNGVSNVFSVSNGFHLETVSNITFLEMLIEPIPVDSIMVVAIYT